MGTRVRLQYWQVTVLVPALVVALSAAVAGAKVTTSGRLCAQGPRTEHPVGRPVCVTVTEYSIPRPPGYYINPGGIAPGPDGRMWFTENAGSAVGLGAITVTGQVFQYTIPTGGSHPGSIVAGPDGRMWFGEDSTSTIGAVTVYGQFTEYPLGTPTTAGSYTLGVGPDERVWFTENGSDKIGAITTTGQVTQYEIPGSKPNGKPASLGGRVWFLDDNKDTIDAITPAGVVTSYSLPHALGSPAELTVGADGRLWVVGSDGVAAVTTGGRTTSFRGAGTAIVAGSDNRLWFFGPSLSDPLASTILSADATGGEPWGPFDVSQDPASGAGVQSGIHHMAPGPDGRIWFTDGAPTDEIGAVTLPGSAGVRCVVPRVLGLTVARARSRLVRAHCQLGRVKRKETRGEAGTIITQRPRPGEVRRRGTRVSVTVGR